MSDSHPPAPHAPDTTAAPAYPRLALLGRLLRFQYRLLLDGLRDLLLAPVSLLVVVYGLIRGGERPERWFDDLCRLGRRSDVWINLFGAYGKRPQSETLLQPLERALREEYARNPHLRRAGVGLEDLLGRLNRDEQAGRESPPDAARGQAPDDRPAP